MCWKRMPGLARPGDHDNLVACHLFSISAAPSGWWNLYAQSKIEGWLVDNQKTTPLNRREVQKTWLGGKILRSRTERLIYFPDWLKLDGYWRWLRRRGLDDNIICNFLFN
jgi:hypothetical protein